MSFGFGFAKLMSQEILLAMFSIARICGPQGLPQAVGQVGAEPLQ